MATAKLPVKEKKQIPEKKPFIIKVEGTVPVIVEFHVLAEDEDMAYEIYKSKPNLMQPLGQPKVNYNKLVRQKISIRSTMSSLIRWIKKF